MNAQQLSTMLQFVGGRPLLILRDHEEGRIKVYIEGEWAMTIVPGGVATSRRVDAMLATREEWAVANDRWEEEHRGSWLYMAYLLTHFQQRGDFPEPDGGDGEVYDPLGLFGTA